ncbi:BRCA2, DNA repair associated [Haematobia irritans]|uniref:BRCA2, DNA repair associated n=1 Tax=Haematobia irritans TaxID=7368 RepID=UPI003F4FD02C
MQDDSITSSPSSSSGSKSIRRARNNRKSNRRSNILKDETNRVCLHLYEDIDSGEDSDGILASTFVVSSRVRDFVPYEIENMLIKADRVPATMNISNMPKHEKGFITCEQFSEQFLDDNNRADFITESELLDCCREIDEMVTNTPRKSFSLVNSILADFALSPITTKSLENPIRYWEYSPQFVLKIKPEKTYSRKYRANKRLQFTEPMPSDDDDDDDIGSSRSSLISVQENVETEDVFNTTVIPDLSEQFSENLLNLSTYFTQKPKDAEEGSPCTYEATNNVVNLMNEISHLRSNMTLDLISYNSEEDFSGFPLKIEEISLSDECCVDETLLSPHKFHIDSDDVQDNFHDDQNVSENSKQMNGDYKDDWSEDCPEIFALIKTQEILNQRKGHVVTAGEDIERNDNVANIFEFTNVGFTTASSKPIRVSKEAERKALDIIKNLPEIKLRQNSKQSKSSAPAENKENQAEKLVSHNLMSSLEMSTELHTEVMPSTSKASNELKIKNEMLYSDNVGFKTANGKSVPISTNALKNVEHLLKEVCSEFDKVNEDDFIAIKNGSKRKACISKKEIVNETEKYWENENELANVVFSEWPLVDELKEKSITPLSHHNSQSNCVIPKDLSKSTSLENLGDGFHTAGGKKLKTSTKGEKAVAHLLNEFTSNYGADNLAQDLDQIKNKIEKKRTESKIHCGQSEAATHEKSNPSSLIKLDGFQTAGGKKLEISSKAENAVSHLLKEFHVEFDQDTFEQDIAAMKTKIHSKQSSLRVTNKSEDISKNILHQFEESGTEVQDLIEMKSKINARSNKTNDMSTEKNNFPNNQREISSPAVSLKRSIDISNISLPPSKRMLTEIKQSFSDLSVRSPLNNSAAKSIISRKNLLSLSKKRKQKSRLSTCEADSNTHDDLPEIRNEHFATPIRTKTSSTVLQNPATPNINDFFQNASNSSTPRTRLDDKLTKDMDEDFRSIECDTSNASCTIKSTINVSSNSTMNSSIPTVDDRIGRLNQYGNPPGISPIAIDAFNNCRPSGLRRTRRSMLKKHDQI